MLAGIFVLQATAFAQEFEGHMFCNPNLFNRQGPDMPLHKTTASAPLSLPFFEDFTGYSVYPDSTKWQDHEVYINNTMGFNPVSRGVATFDALDSRGIPYDSFSNANFRFADSLTSQPINLSVNVVAPADSVYFSFFYQPQGNSYYPLVEDSLILYFKTRFGGFEKVWAVEGSTLKPFQQVMIPIIDSVYYDSSFQFRFVNIGALGWSDAVWNIDYIKLNGGRSLADTFLNDVGFSSDPTFFLNDYSSMPYRQFLAFPPGERAAQYSVKVTNNYNTTQNVICGYAAFAPTTGEILKDNVWNAPLAVPPLGTQTAIFGHYNTYATDPSIGVYDKVVFENTYIMQPVSPTDPPANNAVVKDMIFDNYLAYDDGTAEKSYYLNLYPTLPGKVAIEYHLNAPDTLRGLAIYFGKQVPFPTNKIFSIQVYDALAGVLGSPADNLIFTQDLCVPSYVDTINHFWNYKFDHPVALPSGLFYVGTFQPAESGADSLYFGLDVNRVGSNHAYFNVLAGWTPSLISGAIMMRPLLGQDIVASGVNNVEIKRKRLTVSPNPAEDILKFEFEGNGELPYQVTDVSGRKVKNGKVANGKSINIAELVPGMYFVNVISDGLPSETQKVIKR